MKDRSQRVVGGQNSNIDWTSQGEIYLTLAIKHIYLTLAIHKDWWELESWKHEENSYVRISWVYFHLYRIRQCFSKLIFQLIMVYKYLM